MKAPKSKLRRHRKGLKDIFLEILFLDWLIDFWCEGGTHLQCLWSVKYTKTLKNLRIIVLKGNLYTYIGSSKKLQCKTESDQWENEKAHKFKVCKKSFVQLGNLKAHMVTHTEEKAYNCAECNKSFGQKYYLNRHMITHSGEKPHKCVKCEKSYAFPSRLKRHELTH